MQVLEEFSQRGCTVSILEGFWHQLDIGYVRFDFTPVIQQMHMALGY